MPPPGGRPVKAVVFDIGEILEPPFDDVLVPELAATLGCLSRASGRRPMSGRYVGAEVRRREDPRFLAGSARYLDDLRVAGCLHAAILRSPHAHARILRIRPERARAHPAVVACLTHEDLAGVLRPLPIAGVPPPALQERVGFRLKAAPQLALAADKVRYVGEPVAVVVATDRYAAEDALELVEIEYEILPAVTDVEHGLAPERPSSTRPGATT